MRTLITTSLLMLSSSAFAQGPELTLTPSQNPNALYRLFNTQNVYNLLLLNTKDGSLRQIQWGSNPINAPLAVCPGADVPESRSGRYTLQPTSNLWTFILLDQESGKLWHVQWGLKPGDWFCRPIVRMEDAQKSN